jgi:hypothetical protein
VEFEKIMEEEICKKNKQREKNSSMRVMRILNSSTFSERSEAAGKNPLFAS